MSLLRREVSVSAGCAGGSSPGSSRAAAPSSGASRTGPLTRSLSRKSCCRGPPPSGSHGPTPDSSSTSYRGLPSRKPHWSASRVCSDRSGSGGKKTLAFQSLAQSIVANGGVVPSTRSELERLPGIGPYTASAVLAIVYGRAEPLLDVNMARLLGRFLMSPEHTEARPRRMLHALALRLVSSKRSLEVNWAALDFGALVCCARQPCCPECPLRARCEYARSLKLQPTPTADVLSGSRSAGGR